MSGAYPGVAPAARRLAEIHRDTPGSVGGPHRLAIRMHVRFPIPGVAAKGGDGSYDNGEVVTAVVDEVDDNLKAACTQVKD